jgi:hypothetical protein
MDITLDQSIEITAKAMFNRSGANSIDEALKQSLYLKKQGDNEGFGVWTDIVRLITVYSTNQIGTHPHSTEHNLLQLENAL